MKTLSLRSMSRRATVHLWVFIIAVIAGPLFYLESPKLWSFALLSWALVCATPIVVAIVLIPVIKRCAQGSVQDAVRFRRRLSPRMSKVMCVALVTIDAVLLEWGLSYPLRWWQMHCRGVRNSASVAWCIKKRLQLLCEREAQRFAYLSLMPPC